MIVVAIIGLLVAIALPNFIQARKKSLVRSAQATLKQIDGGYEQYLLDGGTNIPGSSFANVRAALVPKYVTAISDKAPGGNDWTYTTDAAASNRFQASIDGIGTFSAYDEVTIP
jgi:type II secretory pathway pseudopilin PulG